MLKLKQRLEHALMLASSESLDRGDTRQQWAEEVEEAFGELAGVLQGARHNAQSTAKERGS